jgi:hypothetical protein
LNVKRHIGQLGSFESVGVVILLSSDLSSLIFLGFLTKFRRIASKTWKAGGCEYTIAWERGRELTQQSRMSR